jgi:hypothetical protein
MDVPAHQIAVMIAQTATADAWLANRCRHSRNQRPLAMEPKHPCRKTTKRLAFDFQNFKPWFISEPGFFCDLTAWESTANLRQDVVFRRFGVTSSFLLDV